MRYREQRARYQKAVILLSMSDGSRSENEYGDGETGMSLRFVLTN